MPVELAIARLLIAVPLWSAMAFFDAAASDESSRGPRTRPAPSSGRLRDVAP
jgi:hypothetical protein